jgi:hypothetical protein
VVTHLDTLTGSDLELPLSGHDLGVDSRDLDSGVKTSTLFVVVLCIGVSITWFGQRRGASRSRLRNEPR